MNSGKYAFTWPVALKRVVELPLDLLPDGVAVRADDHAALHGRVVGQLGLADDVEIPAGEVLGLGRDLGDLKPLRALRILGHARSRLREPSSVDRLGPGSPLGHVRRGSRRGRARRAPSSQATVTRAPGRVTGITSGGERAPAASRRAWRPRRRVPSRVAHQADVAPHQLAHGVGLGHGRAPARRAACRPRGARPASAPRRAGPLHRARRPGRRRPALRAASCWPGGWRRGRRCRRPRRRRTARARRCGPSQVGGHAAHHVVRRRRHRHRDRVARSRPRSRQAAAMVGKRPSHPVRRRGARATGTPAPPVRAASRTIARETRSRDASSPAGS